MSPGAPPDDETLASEKWDVIIVGSGMGGSTLARSLSRAGRRVLVVEKGLNLLDDSDGVRGMRAEEHTSFDENPEDALARSGRESRAIDWEGRAVIPEIGSGTGGSTALYGGVLERFFEIDFAPGSRIDPEESALPPSWPVPFAEMEPWYLEAESLFEVRRAADRHRGAAAGREAVDSKLGDALRSRGVSPYALPVARRRPECSSCQGYLCARTCKGDAGRMALAPSLKLGVTLAAETSAVFVESAGTRVTAVHVRRAGRVLRLTARFFVLALGAIKTPALLLGSREGDAPEGVANSSGLVGRFLMRHAIDIWALNKAPRVATAEDVKSLGFTDFYFADGNKLGAVQSFGQPPPLEYLKRQRPPAWPWRFGVLSTWLWNRFQGVPLLASILEDYPYPDNRIEVAADGTISARYRSGASEIRRRRRLQERLGTTFRGLGASLVSARDAPKALGHVCGTCRFGDDPRQSVLDRFNRAHDLDNLYVVDASFMPTSGGINPALTVAANALRVGAHLAGRL